MGGDAGALHDATGNWAPPPLAAPRRRDARARPRGGVRFDGVVRPRDPGRWVRRLTGRTGLFPDMVALPPGPERYAWAQVAFFAGRTAAATVPDLLVLADGWRPDLVVRGAAEYGGCIAAEALDLPHAATRVARPTASAGLVVDALDERRVQIGLPTDPTAEMALPIPAALLCVRWARRARRRGCAHLPPLPSDRTATRPGRCRRPAVARRAARTDHGVRHPRYRLQRAGAAGCDHRWPEVRSPQPRRQRRRHEPTRRTEATASRWTGEDGHGGAAFEPCPAAPRIGCP